MSQVSEMLKQIGIKHYLKRVKKTNGEKDYYKIDIYRPHHREFFRVIGSHNPKHLTKYWVEQKCGFCPTHTTVEQRWQILKGELNPVSLVRECRSGQPGKVEGLVA